MSPGEAGFPNKYTFNCLSESNKRQKRLYRSGPILLSYHMAPGNNYDRPEKNISQKKKAI